jgi:hypothetical protein
MSTRHRSIRDRVRAREHEARAKREGAIDVDPLRQPNQFAPLDIRDYQCDFGTSEMAMAPCDHAITPFARQFVSMGLGRRVPGLVVHRHDALADRADEVSRSHAPAPSAAADALVSRAWTDFGRRRGRAEQ